MSDFSFFPFLQRFFFFSPPAADLRHSVHMPASLTLTSLSNSKQKNNKKKKPNIFLDPLFFIQADGGNEKWTVSLMILWKNVVINAMSAATLQTVELSHV